MICEPVSCMTAPAFTMPPKVLLSASSFETSAPTREATSAIGPERLSTMFITRDSLNTDSKLISCSFTSCTCSEAAHGSDRAARSI